MSGTSAASVTNNDLRNLGTGISVGSDANGLTVSGNDVTNVGDDFNFRNLTVGFSLRRRSGDRHSDPGRQRQ
jgi:hypothetical protein